MVTLVTSSLFCQLQCWSSGPALLGQHWDFHSRTGGHSRAGEAGTEQDWGKPPLNLCPFPFPSPHSPDLAENNLFPLCELWAPPGFQCQGGSQQLSREAATSAQNPAPGALFPAQVPLCHPSPNQGLGARSWVPVLAGSDKHLETPAASGEAVGLSALCQPRALCQPQTLCQP